MLNQDKLLGTLAESAVCGDTKRAGRQNPSVARYEGEPLPSWVWLQPSNTHTENIAVKQDQGAGRPFHAMASGMCRRKQKPRAGLPRAKRFKLAPHDQHQSRFGRPRAGYMANATRQPCTHRESNPGR